MDKLQLALLTQWAEAEGLGGIQGRKRMQKVLYFLQQSGCPIQAQYSIHFYGPYSRDVADVTDRMVAENLLDEQAGSSYTYKLNTRTPRLIELTRQRHPEAAAAFEAFKAKAVYLLNEEMGKLELGSTILFMYLNDRDGRDWERAFASACQYKNRNPGDSASVAALALAKQYAPS